MGYLLRGWVGTGLLASVTACGALQSSYSDDAGSAQPPTTSRTDAGARTGADSSSSYDGSYSSDATVPSRDASVPTDDVPPPDASTACEAITDHTPVTLYLSADDSNSMASPVIARRMITQHQIVSKALIRTYEFLNYYNVPYEPATPGTVRVVTQLRASDDAGGYTMQVGVQSESRTVAAARPMVITLVLDTSGSMGSDSRIERERAVVRAIASQLRAGDLVSAVTWSTEQQAVLDGHVVTGPNDPALISLANGLQANGGTDLDSGLAAGYRVATAHFAASALNRVVVISDGEANVGVTSATVIATQSHRAEQEEIYLVGVGVGSGFDDTMMDTLTDRGRGAYVYIDTESEAAAMFGLRFEETMDLADRAVRLELTLPWYLRVTEFHGEAISSDPRQVDPQHLAPNDAMVFHEELTACSSDMVHRDDAVLVRATWEDRDTRAARDVHADTTIGALLDGTDAQLVRGSAIVAYAEALKLAWDAQARGDRVAARAALAHAQQVVDAARAAGNADLAEISGLLTEYAAMF